MSLIVVILKIIVEQWRSLFYLWDKDGGVVKKVFLFL